MGVGRTTRPAWAGMEPDAKSEGPSAEDLDALARFAATLADGVERALPGWVERSVERVHVERLGRRPSADTRAEASAAGRAAADQVGPRVRALLELDIDRQPTGPLAVVREAVPFPTGVLRSAGVPPPRRDEVAERQFPDDDYDLSPASFAELDEGLHEPGLMWGAAKAHVHLARRRAAGQR
jgi:hypothetical protein